VPIIGTNEEHKIDELLREKESISEKQEYMSKEQAAQRIIDSDFLEDFLLLGDTSLLKLKDKNLKEFISDLASNEEVLYLLGDAWETKTHETYSIAIHKGSKILDLFELCGITKKELDSRMFKAYVTQYKNWLKGQFFESHPVEFIYALKDARPNDAKEYIKDLYNEGNFPKIDVYSELRGVLEMSLNEVWDLETQMNNYLDPEWQKERDRIAREDAEEKKNEYERKWFQQ
jgi:hypothetical protein